MKILDGDRIIHRAGVKKEEHRNLLNWARSASVKSIRTAKETKKTLAPRDMNFYSRASANPFHEN